MIGKSELSGYYDVFRNELTGNILPFWTNHVVDPGSGSFHGAVDRTGNPDPGAPKGCVLFTRILWTYSASARILNDSRYAELADRCCRVIMRYFHDEEHGGFFMELDADHRPLKTIKHTYAQAFALYSLCEYYRLNNSAEVLDRIKSFFHLLDQKTKDPDHPGYLEGFTRDWRPICENRMADGNEPKSMNTHLHVLEAFTAVVRVWDDPVCRQKLRDVVEIFINYIIRDEGHFGLFFEKDFSESPASRGTCSFGHDIEGSWLLWEAAELLGDKDLLERVRPIVIKMADAVERTGLDKDGGLFLESTRFGSHIRTNKHWWLQAETVVGYMNAFQLTGDRRYWDNVRLAWSFIDKHVIDHEFGEWFAKVNRAGIPFLSEPADDPSPYYRNDRKADLWKCPYHNSRMCLEMMTRIADLLNCSKQAPEKTGECQRAE